MSALKLTLVLAACQASVKTMLSSDLELTTGKATVNFLIPDGIKSGLLRVSAVPCNAPNGKRHIIGTAAVESGGLAPKPDNQHGFTLATGSAEPHYLGYRPIFDGQRKVELRVGDLRGDKTLLANSYRLFGMSGNKDILGALIFTNDQFVDVIYGEGARTVPVVNVPIKKIQVLGFDRSVRVVGNWSFGEMQL